MQWVLLCSVTRDLAKFDKICEFYRFFTGLVPKESLWWGRVPQSLVPSVSELNHGDRQIAYHSRRILRSLGPWPLGSFPQGLGSGA